MILFIEERFALVAFSGNWDDAGNSIRSFFAVRKLQQLAPMKIAYLAGFSVYQLAGGLSLKSTFWLLLDTGNFALNLSNWVMVPSCCPPAEDLKASNSLHIMWSAILLSDLHDIFA